MCLGGSTQFAWTLGKKVVNAKIIAATAEVDKYILIVVAVAVDVLKWMNGFV